MRSISFLGRSLICRANTVPLVLLWSCPIMITEIHDFECEVEELALVSDIHMNMKGQTDDGECMQCNDQPPIIFR